MLALAFLFCSYVFINLDVSFVDDNSVLKWIKAFQYALSGTDTSRRVPDSILLVNTSYDNVFVPIREYYGDDYIEYGTRPITDHQKLYRLLKLLKETDNYRYLMVDIAFLAENKTTCTDSLYDLIASMRDISVGKIDGKEMDSRIAAKSYDTSHKVSIFNSDYVKQPLFDGDEETLPYHVFSKLTGRHISRFGPFFYEGAHLARRSIYPNFSLVFHEQYPSEPENDEDEYVVQEAMYYNLGHDILDTYDRDTAEPLFRNKLIVIGDFAERDKHQTYAGVLSGPLILLNVVTSLSSDSHIIPYYILFILYIIFFVIADNLLYQHFVPDPQAVLRIRNKLARNLVPLAILSTYYSLLLIVLCAIIYLVTGQAYDILFTGVIIGFAHWVIRLTRKNKSKNPENL